MRMPIFSYFLVVGAVLTGLLIWLGDDGDLQSAPLRTSQQIGVPKPFKGQPETMPDITNANFAAAHARPATERNRPQSKPAKVAAEFEASEAGRQHLEPAGTQLGRRVSARHPDGHPLAERRPCRAAHGRGLRARREPVGHARMAGAVGHAIGRAVAAEVEIGLADGADRPAAFAGGEVEQRAGLGAHHIRHHGFGREKRLEREPLGEDLRPSRRRRARRPGRGGAPAA